MQLVDIQKPLIIIVGPTAVGKTEISIALAEKIGGEIVSADSRLLYRGMDIGTAKPGPNERDIVPHHLIDVADPNQVWSLSMYQKSAFKAIETIHLKGQIPILVGGTGQYIRAIIEGWQIPPQTPDVGLRLELEKWANQIGNFELHKRLFSLDPSAAAMIDAQNVRRVIRALEVIFLTGKRFSAQRLRSSCPYTYCMIGLNRSRTELYERIDLRIEKMIAEGLVEETRNLLIKGYSEVLPPLSAIGYIEIIGYLRGYMTLDEAITIIKRRTRKFVRRQAAWFGEKNPDITWLNATDVTIGMITSVLYSEKSWIFCDPI